ncbi:uncharacterized protein LOC110424790 [Herrania umbratica]|uniref:Uncharacterized protein LOC110424790 n=1 Tax=Herrania umbratica TaxID=108875 RepID=A0A6J1B7I4_9ROSI|nr:uncharacterized protein LOC110424790 [Herrania umbratica]
MGKWKICCGVTAILFIIVAVVFVILTFTLFKPKDPKITPQSVTLESIDLVVFPVIKGNVSLGLVVTVDNPNYGGFKYMNSTAYVNYRGNLVAEAPIESDSIPARAKHNISTTVIVFADKLATDPNFPTDFLSGVLNFTSSTILHGKVRVLNLLKLKASSSSGCNISILVQTESVDSVCKSKIRL